MTKFEEQNQQILLDILKELRRLNNNLEEIKNNHKSDFFMNDEELDNWIKSIQECEDEHN